MNATSNPNTREQALEWFFKLRRQDSVAADRQAFEQWLAESQSHAQAFAQVERVWQADALHSALTQLDDELKLAAPIPLPPRTEQPSPAHRMRYWAMAASLLLAVVWTFQTAGWVDDWRADYVTATGGQTQLTLADGSEVMLNTDSALQLHDGNPRSVSLLRGEAYFKVQADPTRPFTVNTAHGRVTVLGTRFSVRSDQQTNVDLESGRVECANLQGDSRQLMPGQHADLLPGNPIAISQSDPDAAFGWTHGRLIFQDRPLAEVLAELDRYYPGMILLTRNDLAGRRVSGNYKLDDIRTILRELAQMLNADLRPIAPFLTLFG